MRRGKKGGSSYRTRYLRIRRLSFNAFRWEDNRNIFTDGRTDGLTYTDMDIVQK